jgi:hypothetical protein
MTWKTDTIFNFWEHFPMYMGCSGATYVYPCCIVGKVCICGKNVFLALGFAKRDEKSAYGNGTRPSGKYCMG